MISKNFKYSEFEYSETAEEWGVDNRIPDEVKPRIKALVLNILQPLRDVWGVMPINSGYRCKRLNGLLRGAETSQHLSGCAADVSCSNPIKLAKLAKDMGLPFDQIGVYPTFLHISHRQDGCNRGQIFYDKSYKGEKLV